MRRALAVAYRRRLMKASFNGRRVHPGGLVLGVVVAALFITQVAIGDVQGPLVAAVIGGVLLGVCMLMRRSYPWPCLLAVFAVIVVTTAIGIGEQANYAFIVAGFVAVYTLGSQVSLRQALIGFAVALVAGFLAALPATGPTKSAFVAFVLIAALVIGRSVGNYRRLGDKLQATIKELEAGQDELVAARLADEKVKIARELHDIVAHAVSVMVIQASAAEESLHANPERARQPLIAVQESGRQALGELRRLLGVLRPGVESATILMPQPRLTNLPVVVQGLRDGGIDVTMKVTGKLDSLPPGVDLAAFRVVQEALTNVLKHSSASCATVDIRCDYGTIDLAIADNGQGEARPCHEGHGLLGMRERVVAYGGSLRAGTEPSGGYRVTAHMKIPQDR